MHSDAPARTITTPRLQAANRPDFIPDQELFLSVEYNTDSIRDMEREIL
jgi:hypothetical protein